MVFRTFDNDQMYVIKAPEGSKLILDDDGAGELILFETMSDGTVVERRFPTAMVIKAAQRQCFGLSILERRRPLAHPEIKVRHASR